VQAGHAAHGHGARRAAGVTQTAMCRPPSTWRVSPVT
jgi:hypothetical protein